MWFDLLSQNGEKDGEGRFGHKGLVPLVLHCPILPCTSAGRGVAHSMKEVAHSMKEVAHFRRLTLALNWLASMGDGG